MSFRLSFWVPIFFVSSIICYREPLKNWHIVIVATMVQVAIMEGVWALIVPITARLMEIWLGEPALQPENLEWDGAQDFLMVQVPEQGASRVLYGDERRLFLRAAAFTLPLWFPIWDRTEQSMKMAASNLGRLDAPAKKANRH